MAARLARWEESRRRNALKQQRQPQHVTTDVGRHDLFAQPHKQSSPIKDPFARPPLQLEPTDEQLGQPRLRRPEIKVSAPPGGETSWAIADAGAPEPRYQRPAHARASMEDMNSKERYRRDIEAQIRANEERKANERHSRRRAGAEDDARVARESAALRREVALALDGAHPRGEDAAEGGAEERGRDVLQRAPRAQRLRAARRLRQGARVGTQPSTRPRIIK